MRTTFYLALFLCLLAGRIEAQVQVLPLRENRVQYLDHKAHVKRMAQQHFRKGLRDSSSLSLPFVDDFSADHFPGNANNYPVFWEPSGAWRNNTWAIDPPTIGVVTMDGADASGYPYDWASTNSGVPCDTLLSRPIDLSSLSTSDQVGISFYFQPQGLGNAPEASQGDSLVLDFYAPDIDQWFHKWAVVGNAVVPFKFEYIPLDNDRYFKNGFRFRFRNYGRTTGAIDQWQLDYIRIEQGGTNMDSTVNDVSFMRQENTLLNTYTSVPWKAFRADPSSYMRPSIDLEIGNLNNGPRTLEGNTWFVDYDGSQVANFSNPNNPAIAAYSHLTYTQPVNQNPNNFVYPTNVNDTSADFEVYFRHGVSDLAATNTNDTMRFVQHFRDYYAYDDGSAEVAFAVSGNASKFATRFDISQGDSIWGGDFYFLPFDHNQENAFFYMSLWSAGDNGPGNLIEDKIEQVHYSHVAPNTFQTFRFDSLRYLEPGSYYFGYSQLSSELTIGADENTDANTTRGYYEDPSQGSGGWGALTDAGSLMIRPRFNSPLNPSGLNTPSDAFPLTIYPNPARDQIHLQWQGAAQGNLQIFSIRGQMVMNQPASSGETVNLSKLPSGLYLVNISLPNGSRVSKKIMVQH